MPIGYKYVERDAQDTQINWAEVGANFSGMLQEENRVREEKKDALDEQARAYQNSLNSIPTGQNTQLNDAALNFAADLQEQALMLNKNLKAGLLSPRDYTRYMQNLMDGTTQAFGLFDDYNQEYSRKMKMVEDGTLSQVDLEIMANTESFANFQNHRLVINPDDSKVASARMIEGPDGTLVPDTNPNHLALVSVLRDRIRQTVPKFDVMGVSQQRAKALGKDERTIIESMGTAYKAGIFKQVSDIRQRERYGDKTDAEYAKELGIKEEDFKAISLFNESQDKWAKSQVSSDVNSMAGASTLVDFITSKGGTQYTTTFDPKGVFNEDGSRDETIILLENKNGRVVSNLTDIQQANAEQALKDQSESMIDTKVTTKTVFTEKAPPVVNRSRGGGGGGGGASKINYSEAAGMFAKFWYGTMKEKNEAANYFGSINRDIKSILPRKDDVLITFRDGTTDTIYSMIDNQRFSQDEFVIANFNKILKAADETVDIRKILKKGGLRKDAVYSPIASTGFTGRTEKVKSNNPFENLSVYATQQFNPSKKSSASNTVELFNKIFGPLGYRSALSPQGNVDIFTSGDDKGKRFKPNFISGMKSYVLQAAQQKGKDNPAFLKQLMDLPTGNSMSGF